jgi:SAM-dependent methyltransferase
LLENRTPRLIGLEIAAVSALILFQELALIRWIPSQVRVVAYFPNVVLMSAFLGLGIGCLVARRPLGAWAWPASMWLLVLASIGMSRVAFTQESTNEHLWLLYLDLQNPPVVNDTRLPIVVAFVLSALSFVPLGQFLAKRIAEMTALGRTLRGYALDLLGSLAGVIGFAVLSYFWTPPVVWFAVFLGAATWLFGKGSARRLALLGLSGAVLLGAVWTSTKSEIFSPYYGISTMAWDQTVGKVVLTNGTIHQYPAPIASGPDVPGLTDNDRRLQEGYPIPYRMLRTPPRRVLVLGAGTGNDVATALAAGAEVVHAVEIDPAITALGREIHPDKPYSDPRVRVFDDDARSFLEKTDQKYDLIVFGTLDSMTRLSALSSVRLDNFVYTRESLEAARAVMAPDGGIAMYFWVETGFIADRLINLHDDVFGRMPAALRQHFVMFNLLLMSGPAYDHIPRQEPDPEAKAAWKASIEPSTDDWPYLYLKGRGLTPFYIQMILVFAAISALAVFGASEEMRSTVRRGRVDVEMLALGGAFLLLETKSVTEMNLAWGATWLTSAIVFGSILFMLLCATLLMDRFAMSSRTSVALLAVTLIIAYFSPVHFLLGKPWPVKLLLSVFVVGSPIFFASTLFAVRFKARRSTDVALGWNLLGAVLGGLLEFSSMMIGIRNLSLLALALYLVATLARSSQEGENPSGAHSMTVET